MANKKNNEILNHIKIEIEETQFRIECAMKHTDTKKELEYLNTKQEVLESLLYDLQTKF